MHGALLILHDCEMIMHVSCFCTILLWVRPVLTVQDAMLISHALDIYVPVSIAHDIVDFARSCSMRGCMLPQDLDEAGSESLDRRVR